MKSGTVCFSQIPNGLGTLFGVAQLILYATYYKSTQRILAERKLNSTKEVNLSEVVVADQEEQLKKLAATNGRAPQNHH